ncbi:yippee-domain-containing protein [Durotheca rogersii]|uniref:yippee-domain-containing protein n=1 Tax=Durotheca rogersii TaxID=419775 RepID=UPI00221F44C6|nr:yippee-domain-containing protein [Durotheca rogersii]KAI5867120.1 yippee-domain-containing protein [Durotheca rogersii]
MYSMMFNDVMPAPFHPTLPPAPSPAHEESGALKFPVYLLGGLSVPFRRRRQSPRATREIPADEESPPSLSTSPMSSVVSNPVGSLRTRSLFVTQSLMSNSGYEDRYSRSSVEPLSATKLTQAQPDTIRCSTCASDFAFCSQIVSKGFTGRYGRAYLVSQPDQLPPKGAKTRDLMNIRVGKPETRLLVTGSHVVADITCLICHTKVGWKYIDAKEETQQYKIGKFILETQRVVVFRGWEDVVVDEMPELEVDEKQGYFLAGNDEEPVTFDSDDEDECEDLFAGMWDPAVVAKRRNRKVNRHLKNNAT